MEKRLRTGQSVFDFDKDRRRIGTMFSHIPLRFGDRPIRFPTILRIA